MDYSYFGVVLLYFKKKLNSIVMHELHYCSIVTHLYLKLAHSTYCIISNFSTQEYGLVLSFF